MANKFSKSILDRLELEARSQTPVAGEQHPSPFTEEFAILKGDRELREFTGYIHDHPRRRAKGKTFYLDEELIDALNRTATAKSVSESRLVNDILRSVLGI